MMLHLKCILLTGLVNTKEQSELQPTELDQKWRVHSLWTKCVWSKNGGFKSGRHSPPCRLQVASNLSSLPSAFANHPGLDQLETLKFLRVVQFNLCNMLYIPMTVHFDLDPEEF